MDEEEKEDNEEEEVVERKRWSGKEIENNIAFCCFGIPRITWKNWSTWMLAAVGMLMTLRPGLFTRLSSQIGTNMEFRMHQMFSTFTVEEIVKLT